MKKSNKAKAYYYHFTCETEGCENEDLEFAKTHSDELKAAVIDFNDRREGIGEFQIRRYVALQSICPFCKFKGVSKEVETDEIKDPKLHEITKHIPADAKSRPGYYTQYKTTHGGVPEFNPVTENGGPGGGRSLE